LGVSVAYLVVAIVTLEVVDEGVNVLILLLLLGHLLLDGHRVGLLLIKLSALNVGRQRGSASSRVFGHWRGGCGR
jgi:hypothetical protein